MPTPRWPHARAPTVDDLKTKRCWICLGEYDMPELSEGETPRLAQDRWVHACNCSLVSHESCLLTWIESFEENLATAAKAPRCPQCGARYTIKTKRTRLLRFFNRGYSVMMSFYRVVGIGLGIGSVVLVAATYGGVVMRIFLGEQAFSLYFGDSIHDWMFHCIDFAFVPTTLLLSDTSLFDSIIPITTPMLFIPANFAMNENARTGWLRFPPTPAVTMFAWPYVRICYNYVWGRVVKLVTGKDLGGSLVQLRRDLEILRAQRDEIVEEHAMVEEEHAALVAQEALRGVNAQNGDVDPPPLEVVREAAAPVAIGQQRPGPIANNANPNGNGNGNDGNAPGRVITITFGLAARTLLSSLFAPIIGHGIGSGLHRWACRESWLASAMLKRILGLGAKGHANSLWNASGRWSRGGKGFGPLMPLGLRPAVENLDPVWWRNAVGMAIYVFAADAFSLFHLWLVIRERRHRKITDRSFRGFDLSSLDLVETQ